MQQQIYYYIKIVIKIFKVYCNEHKHITSIATLHKNYCNDSDVIATIFFNVINTFCCSEYWLDNSIATGFDSNEQRMANVPIASKSGHELSQFTNYFGNNISVVGFNQSTTFDGGLVHSSGPVYIQQGVHSSILVYIQ